MKALLNIYIIFTFFASVGWAKVNIEDTVPFTFGEVPLQRKGPDIFKSLATDFKQGDSESKIISRFADKGINYWLNSSQMSDVGLIRVAKRTQDKLKTDVHLPSDDPLGIKHKFSFRVEVFQAMAKVEYSGWLKAAASYDARNAVSDISIKEKLTSNKVIFLSLKTTREQELSTIGIAWSF